ncbi:hypothetical protein U4E84_15545 [Halorubrum sp. AD140]|uniref:DUF7551 domain-containing protein n=1 Tax=Halorubrum sp. AD140 TaxID=3050073 RepID=UPI002ACC954B|nr:hypothetical protein [Halorubrum sp. AD140]MDZ5812759.1 hypothetical protein [Halorubrum sp. AD140]
MIGTTLTELRDHIESLASEDGDYALVCARYGDRPVPASDLRFETRATARAAAHATTRYRRALRRYDPQVPYYDIVVCQEVDRMGGTTPIRTCCESEHGTRDWSLSEPVVNRRPAVARELVEFCHRVAAAVFETLSRHGYDLVESAIMNAYFVHAEELADPDGLCVRLLESMAVELGDRLSPSEQVTLLSAAAGRLEYAPDGSAASLAQSPDRRTVEESLSVLREVGLFRRGTTVTGPADVEEGPANLVVDVSGYALRPHCGRLPLLPIALAVHRCEDAWVPTRMEASDDGWRIAFRSVAGSDPIGRVDRVFAPEVR